jgi:hypothetical protein
VYFILARSRSARASRQRISGRRLRWAKRSQSRKARFRTTGYPGWRRASRSSMPALCERAPDDMTGVRRS